MFDILEGFYDYYYIVLVLQAICAFHSFRRGTQNKWIWVIVFLPLIGSLVYIFTEIIKKQHIDSVQSGVVNIVNPGGRIKELEQTFKFSNTFANRVALADAYFEAGQLDKAIDTYEPGLTGLFHDNEHVIKNLIQAYFHFGRFDDIIKQAPKISKSMEFSKSPANLMYAIALEKTGQGAQAETEYKKMNHRYANYEARYYYGAFLVTEKRKEEASLLFNEILEESQHLNRGEKGANKIWIEKSEQAWKALMLEA